jgi:ribose transport system substrate-binding protein
MSGRRFTNLCLFTLAVVIGGGMTVAMVSSPHGEQPLRLLLITSGSEVQRYALVDGARTAAEERGVELLVRSVPQSPSDSFVESIASVIADGIQGAVASPEITNETLRELRKASGATDVVRCSADADAADSILQVGTNQYSAGRICGNLIRRTFPQGGRVVVLVGDDGVAATRLAALREALDWDAANESHQWELSVVRVGQSVGDLDSQLDDELEREPAVSCVVDLSHCTSKAVTALVAAAAEKLGAQFITFDSSAEALAAVETGQIYAVICDNAFDHGYQAVQHLVSICRGSYLRRPAPGHGNVFVPATIVRRGNVAEYRAHAMAAMASPAA